MGGGGGGFPGGDRMGNLGAGLRDLQWDLSLLPKFEKNFYMVISARQGEQPGRAQ
jgi:ATP-dependent RNA helicase DDX5/DBP2